MPRAAAPVVIAGAQVPDTLAPRIIAALRHRYASVVANITDDTAAVKAVVQFWLTESLAEHQVHQATSPLQAQVSQLSTDIQTAQVNARQQAQQDGNNIN
jgi:hypothetical protein